MKKILYIYGNLPSYREEFFTQLSSRLEEEGIGILDSALSRDQVSFELPRERAAEGLRALHALCFE